MNDDGKPDVDPHCLCHKPHPCPDHGKPEPPPALFDAEPYRAVK